MGTAQRALPGDVAEPAATSPLAGPTLSGVRQAHLTSGTRRQGAHRAARGAVSHARGAVAHARGLPAQAQEDGVGWALST